MSKPSGRVYIQILGDTLREFTAANGPFLSAGLAFYALLYCFPLLLLFLTALGYLLEGSELAMRATTGFLQTLFPASEESMIDAVESFTGERHLLGLVTFASLLLFGSLLFRAVRHVLNVVFTVEQPRRFWKGLGADVLAMLGTGGLLALAVGLATLIALLIEAASRLGLGPWLDPGWALLGRALTFLFAAALFFLLFRVGPAKCPGPRSLLAGSIAGAVLLELSKWLFLWFVREAGDYAVLYGALSGLVFFVLWIYYACLVFVLAATFARVLGSAESAAPLSLLELAQNQIRRWGRIRKSG
jgi:membrane protein